MGSPSLRGLLKGRCLLSKGGQVVERVPVGFQMGGLSNGWVFEQAGVFESNGRALSTKRAGFELVGVFEWLWLVVDGRWLSNSRGRWGLRVGAY